MDQLVCRSYEHSYEGIPRDPSDLLLWRCLQDTSNPPLVWHWGQELGLTSVSVFW